MTQETLERIKQEKKELNEKIEKLSDFLFSKQADSLTYANFYLLSDQHKVMKKYSKILQCRIELNENNIDDEK